MVITVNYTLHYVSNLTTNHENTNTIYKYNTVISNNTTLSYLAN